MNAADILNTGYSAPTAPDVTVVGEALRRAKDHVLAHKGPYALLAASLPFAGYGIHRAIKTPDADPGAMNHTVANELVGDRTSQSEKIAHEVLARYGLDKIAFDRLPYAPAMKNLGVMGSALGGVIGAGTSMFRQRNDAGPMDWQRVGRAGLMGAGAGGLVGAGVGAKMVHGVNQNVARANKMMDARRAHMDSLWDRVHSGTMNHEQMLAAVNQYDAANRF